MCVGKLHGGLAPLHAIRLTMPRFYLLLQPFRCRYFSGPPFFPHPFFLPVSPHSFFKLGNVEAAVLTVNVGEKVRCDHRYMHEYEIYIFDSNCVDTDQVLQR